MLYRLGVALLQDLVLRFIGNRIVIFPSLPTVAIYPPVFAVGLLHEGLEKTGPSPFPPWEGKLSHCPPQLQGPIPSHIFCSTRLSSLLCTLFLVFGF